METNQNLYEPKEPTAAAMREKFVELLAPLPTPVEMTDHQLSECAEILAQIEMDVMEVYKLLDAEIDRRQGSRGGTTR